MSWSVQLASYGARNGDDMAWWKTLGDEKRDAVAQLHDELAGAAASWLDTGIYDAHCKDGQ